MSQNFSIKFSITPTWEVVKQIREETESFLKFKNDQEIIEATIMTASELIENAVKFGKISKNGTGIEFAINVDDNVIKIKVTNGIASEKNAAVLKKHIDAINKSNNAESLYVQRLMELMEDTKQGVSQLGLYRIAYEGNFKLAYEIHDDIVAVIAARKIN